MIYGQQTEWRHYSRFNSVRNKSRFGCKCWAKQRCQGSSCIIRITSFTKSSGTSAIVSSVFVWASVELVRIIAEKSVWSVASHREWVEETCEQSECSMFIPCIPCVTVKLLEFWANYTEFLPSSQAIPALPTVSNACSKEKKTFYSVSWIKRQWHAVDYI